MGIDLESLRDNGKLFIEQMDAAKYRQENFRTSSYLRGKGKNSNSHY